MEQIDVIEVLNSRTPIPQRSAKSLAFAEKYDIAKSAGSDAHILGEIGNAYVEMPEFNGKDDFLQALIKGKSFGHRGDGSVTSLTVYFGLHSANHSSTWSGDQYR